MDKYAVKKILCDSAVAANATAVSKMVADGDITNVDQLKALTLLDEHWLHQTMSVATGDVKVIQEILSA